MGNIRKRERERQLKASKQEGKERSSRIEGACDGQGVGNPGGRTKDLYKSKGVQQKSTKDFTQIRQIKDEQ